VGPGGEKREKRKRNRTGEKIVVESRGRGDTSCQKRKKRTFIKKMERNHSRRARCQGGHTRRAEQDWELLNHRRKRGRAKQPALRGSKVLENRKIGSTTKRMGCFLFRQRCRGVTRGEREVGGESSSGRRRTPRWKEEICRDGDAVAERDRMRGGKLHLGLSGETQHGSFRKNS